MDPTELTSKPPVHSRMRIYLATPTEWPANSPRIAEVHDVCKAIGTVWTPGPRKSSGVEADDKKSFAYNLEQLEKSDVVVAILAPDLAPAWEMGYATARNKTVIAIRHDIIPLPRFPLNLMIERSAYIVDSLPSLRSVLIIISSDCEAHPS